MCGIGGIIRFEKKIDGEGEIKKMMNRIQHRGPDGEGVFLEDRLAFGHRRLSIIDLTDAGHQPMVRNELILTFNGEIYNYIEIREELKALGHIFYTASDSEVLLAAYQQWGQNCTSHFNGMWAFAIYDRKKQIVFCSRDRFGKKPFYYTIEKDKFIFCSEIKGILEVVPKAKANLHTIAQYLVLNQVETTDHTFFEGIEKLPAGCSGVFDLKTNQFVISRYYDISFLPEVNKLSEEETVKRYHSEFERAIRWRLRSDVKVATSLSGGLDSSYLSALASDMYHQQSAEPFSAITAASVDPTIDETHFAEMVVKHCGLNWIVTKPATDKFLEVIEDVIWTQEEPFHSTSMVMQYFVMKAAHEAGIVVMLDGQGADETMLGYYNHMISYVKRLPLYKQPKAILQVADHYAVNPVYFLKLYYYFGSSSLRKNRQQLKWANIKQEYKGSFLDFSVMEEMSSLLKGNLFDYQKLDLQVESIPKLLRYEDKNSMRFSIETRLPFLDYNLVEVALSANDNFKIKDGWSKNILRKAMEPHLPKEITWRKNKFGFLAPDKEWLSDKTFFHHKIASSNILKHMMKKVEMPQKDNAMLWRMSCLAMWEQVYNVEV